MEHSVATVINFCSTESRFIKACIEQALLFSKQVIVAVCDHFFDGRSEDMDLLKTIYAAFPECLFVQYPFFLKEIPKTVDQHHFWHSLSRLLGTKFVGQEIEYILFLDADEIADGKSFIAWLNEGSYRKYTVMKMANYWYFREPCYQATTWEDSVVFARKKMLSSKMLIDDAERDGLYFSLPEKKIRRVASHKNEPMFHHYSWVRTKEEMCQKVQTWGHSQDRNWLELVEQEFLLPFSGKDFVHGYSYQTVENIFSISLLPPHFIPKAEPNVCILGKKEVLSIVKKAVFPFWGLLFRLFS